MVGVDVKMNDDQSSRHKGIPRSKTVQRPNQMILFPDYWQPRTTSACFGCFQMLYNVVTNARYSVAVGLLGLRPDG